MSGRGGHQPRKVSLHGRREMFCTTTTSIFRSHSEFRSRLKRKAISGRWQTFSPGQVPQRQSGIYALRLCPDFWQRADRGLYRPAFSGNVRHAGEFRKKRMVVTREDSQERDANPNRKGRQNVSIDRYRRKSGKRSGRKRRQSGKIPVDRDCRSFLQEISLCRFFLRDWSPGS